MSDLVRFLRARIEHRLTTARAALDDGTWYELGGYLSDREGACLCATSESHIVANPPAQVIRDCEADLKLLDAHVGYYGAGDDDFLPIPTLSILAEKYDRRGGR